MASPQSDTLYDGERLWIVNDAPALTYFLRGDPSKPLTVFIPGAYHNARIAYGGHHGSKSSDFLGHWVQQSGHSFLAVSYPLESHPTVMPPIRPDFTVREWGAQAVEITKQIIEEQNLSEDVILLFWSMGGKILQPFTLDARSRGLRVKLAVSLVGTPALRGLREPPPGLTASETGYAYSPSSTEYFYALLHEQNAINGGRTIISDEIYLREYLGSTPIALGAWGLRWSIEKRKLVEDKDAGYEVAEATGPADLPFLGAISGDSALDYRHTIADKATWTFIMTYQLMAAVNDMTRVTRSSSESVVTASSESTALPAAREKRLWLIGNPEKAKRMIKIIQDLPEKMCAVVQGNHHFFLGEKGAKETAELIVSFQSRVDEFKGNILVEVGQ